jgi:hypothetical protein
MIASNILATSIKAQASGYPKLEALKLAFQAHTGHLERHLRLTLWSLLTGLPSEALN